MDSESNANQTDSRALRIFLFSFGFKHGVPVDANLLLDIRFLPNPYWQEDLRPKSGLEKEVSTYVVDSDQGREFLQLLVPLLLSVADGMAQTGRELRIGIGCTGGRHRSVYLVDRLASSLGESFGEVLIHHREMQP